MPKNFLGIGVVDGILQYDDRVCAKLLVEVHKIILFGSVGPQYFFESHVASHNEN